MKYSDKSQAYVEALSLNAVSLNEIIAWADSVILKEDEPTIDFIELAMCKNNGDAVSLLNKISKDSDEELAFKYLFGLLFEALKNGSSSYQEVSKRLYFWAAYETELEGYSYLTHFWDAIDLADIGSIGDPKEVRKELLEYLQKHRLVE